MASLMEVIDELLVSGHPAVIHFPIIGIMMGFMAGATALAFGVFRDMFKNAKWFSPWWENMVERMIDRYGFASWIMILMGELGLIVAGLSGLQSAGSVENALSSEILAYKVKLTIYVFCILLSPLLLKIYMVAVVRRPVFGESRIIPLLYLTPMAVAAFLTMLISGAGGRYTYGHSILDTLGLGWLLPF
ncbi:MAG: hypothetical protein ACW98K_12410 [Candidatus Kariarchaeaceae archaeon]|jgi:hypothetical protein